MSAVWARAKSQLRSNWKATVLLAVLVGLVGGVTMFGVAGARRTASAMERFLDYYRPFDAFVFGSEDVDIGAVARLPQVVDADTQAYLLLVPTGADGRPDPTQAINPFVSTMGSTGSSSQRPLVVSGHLPDPDEPLEVAVNEELAHAQDVRPGANLRLWAYRPDQFFEVLEAPGTVDPQGPAIDLRVTAVVRHPFDISPDPSDQEVSYATSQGLYLTPAFATRYEGQVADYDALLGPALVVRLAGGVDDLPAFTESVRSLPGGGDAEVQPADTREQASRTTRAIDLQARALLAFAALVGVAGMVVVGQSLARQVASEAGEHPVLRAVGMTPVQLAGAAVVRALLVGMLGAALAGIVAVSLSPLSPVGLARAAEVDPGVSVDPPVLGLGALAVMAVISARVALPVRRAARASAQPAVTGIRRPSRLADRLAGAGAPASAVAGVRMALEPGTAESTVPVRAALAGTAVAVAAVAGGLAFSASLDHLVATPALQGWTWDVTVGDETVDIHDSGRDLLASNPVVDGFTAMSGAGYRIEVHGTDLSITGLEQLEGDVGPKVIDGRLPEHPHEVAFGPRTADRLGIEVGDEVAVGVEGAEAPTPLTVVGTALLGPALDYTVGIGEGAVTTLEAMAELFGEMPTAYFLVDYAPGVDADAAFASLQADWGRQVARPRPAVDVENLRRVSGLPVAFSALLAVVAVVTLGHTLVTSVRRRSRDLAVLKALGFAGRQVSATVAWQATTLMVVALAIGLPLGVAAGRWGWTVVADGIGAPAPAVTPVVVVLAGVPVALAVAGLASAYPARRAARTRPAVALRAE